MTAAVTPPIRILLITADMPLARQIIDTLKGKPFLVQLARSTAEARKEDRHLGCDLALLDEALGAVDGWALARSLRDPGDGRKVAVLGLVSRVELSEMGDTGALGLEGFVRKATIEHSLVQGLLMMARKATLLGHEGPGDYRSPEILAEVLALLQPTTRPTGIKPPVTLDAATVLEAPPVAVDPGAVTARTSEGGDATTANLANGSGTRPVDMTWLEDQAPPPPDLSGTELGKIRLEEKIGSGAGGAVYRATHVNLGIPVAVKVLHAELADRDSEYAMAFMAEARTAARVSHANVIRVLDVDRDPASGAYFLVMEFVQGRSLEEEITRKGRISEDRLIGIAIGIGHALVAAAELGIVHRDIKPANILLDSNDMVKVADLGLAKRGKHMEPLAARSRLESMTARQKKEMELFMRDTRDLAIQGTPYYMSPEQINDPVHLDARADIYAFGATLYHAATGEVPFTGESIPDILLHQLESAPRPPTELNPKLTVPFSRLILRMMEKDRASRPSGPREVLSMLRDHLDYLKSKQGTRHRGPLRRGLRRMMGR